MGIIPGRVTYIIDKKGVVRHIFNSQTQAQRHVEEAKQTLEQLEQEEKAAAGLTEKHSLLNLYNTLTRKIEPFKPAEDKQVKMYTCGPSTYQRAHIGNYRTFLYEDILQRYLEYLGYKVTRLMTLTDVEDKAIAASKKRKPHRRRINSKKRSGLLQRLRTAKNQKTRLPRQSINRRGPSSKP